MGPGDLVTFRYQFWRHDPNPLVLVTGAEAGLHLYGLNLHYLTVPIVRSILQQSCGNPGFSFDLLGRNSFIRSAFRTYLWHGVGQVRQFDCQTVLGSMDVDKYRKESMSDLDRQVRDQMARRSGQPIPAEYLQQASPNAATQPLVPTQSATQPLAPPQAPG